MDETEFVLLSGTPHVACFRSEDRRGLSSRPDGPPDPVATGDMPWARGCYSSCVGNAHVSKCSQPFGRISLWLHWTWL